MDRFTEADLRIFPKVRVTFGQSGLNATFDLPDIEDRTSDVGGSNGSEGATSPSPPEQNPRPALPAAYSRMLSMREIQSASVEQLTSQTLIELRDMIAEARRQRDRIALNFKDEKQSHETLSSELERRKRSIFRIFYRRRIEELEEAVPEAEIRIKRLSEWQASTAIRIRFEGSDEAQKAYGGLVRSFEASATPQ